MHIHTQELNVPDKGKEGFEKLFGLSWDSALKSGLYLCLPTSVFFALSLAPE
jgi:hypothetical protein